MISQVAFVQRSLTSEKGPGEYSYNINADELFHVDLELKDIVWRLPRFRDLSTYPAESALRNIAVLRSNLEILMRRSNNTPVENVPPKVTLYPEKPVELGEPNVLVCLADGFLPPVISLTWVKNGQEVKDTEETDFYPNKDHSFRKFSYLTFVPNAEDIYYCRVEHWGLAQPLTKEWNPNMAEPLPETAESVVCGLGLVVGVVGIIVGTVFFIKGRRNNEANVRRRPM
ncbi:PREDICTED: mamu class II histocompatibility antigen, DR alpha chain-like [Gekko japonicus]|uniref:Mamu class II histocompatibility antigen, DR alpha chain-like n=1 Tax=Gekko japonicus TaxID=146911 RepID=A0ABM1JP97_GEKJA|nr:PREDICTED: mamu class II histocompatibility antigen, DR alpha chain-like [Gekko japonicus]